MAVMQTLYSHIFAVLVIIWILVNAKLDVSWCEGFHFKTAGFIGLLNFEWHRQNEVGNVAILVLWRDLE